MRENLAIKQGEKGNERMKENTNVLTTEDAALTRELREMYEGASSETETVKGLVYIPIDKLHPHPDNPRKELGDLYELTESIKVRGIMQNLTVVPYEDGYRIIIGHRRAAAAKEAGLTSLPCVIVEMTPEEQVATMLVENIQRSDLTVYEQAQSFQLMMDMGETVTSLSEKTGFSVATVRRRIKLNELDQEKLKEASGKQITMDDLDRLSRIKDVNTRNIVLGFAGTANFENELKKAKEAEQRSECAAMWRRQLMARGITEITMAEANSGKYSFEGYVDIFGKYSQLDEKIKGGKRYFFAIYGNSVYLRAEKDKAKDDESPEALREKLRKQEREARIALLCSASERAYESRREFILSYSSNDAKKHIKEATEVVIRCKYEFPYASYDYELFAEACEVEKEKSRKWNEVSYAVSSHPEYALICHAYASLGDRKNMNYYDIVDGSHRDNRILNVIYSFLEKLGYEMNDEERALREGTSDMFAPIEMEEEEDGSDM